MNASYLCGGLRPSDDEPLLERPAGMTRFSEGLYFVGHDAEASVSFWTAIHPMVYDFSLLREMLAIYLPDGTVLLARGYGRARRPRVQAASTLSFTCVEPFSRWRVEFDGVAQRVPRADTLQGLVPDGPREPVRLSVEVTASAPPWLPSAGGTADAAAVDRHPATFSDGADIVPFFLQLWTFTGKLEWAGRTLPLSGTGIRDHSRGNRDLAGHTAHELLGAQFPSGRGFHILRLRGHGDYPGFALGAIVDREQIWHCADVETTSLETLLESGENVSAKVRCADRELVATGVTVSNCGWTLLPPNEPVYGVDLRSPDNVALVHGIVRWECDGEVAYGLLERSAPVGRFAES
jgi:hypothetical protein